MCGRHELIAGQRVYRRFHVSQPTLPMLANADNGDVRPSQQVVALQTDRVLSLMKWGLVPAWAKDPRIGNKSINARAEGIERRPPFKRPLRFQRCIIPASAFFDWKGTAPGRKVKYRIARRDGELFGSADPYTSVHAPNESISLERFAQAIRHMARLLLAYGAEAGGGGA